MNFIQNLDLEDLDTLKGVGIEVDEELVQLFIEASAFDLDVELWEEFDIESGLNWFVIVIDDDGASQKVWFLAP